jgi:hypothetical protein
MSSLRRLGRRFLVATLIAAVFSACPIKPEKPVPSPVLNGAHPGPTPPATPDDPHPAPAYFRHSFTLSWGELSLAGLASLSLQNEGRIEVSAAPAGSNLSIEVTADIETVKHEQLSLEFQKSVVARSSFSGENPKLVIPRQHCSARGRYVVGICTHPIRLIVPPLDRVNMNLSWTDQALIENVRVAQLGLRLPSSGIARVLTARGKIRLEGGGPGTHLLMDDIEEVQAHLEAIGNLAVTGARGPAFLDIRRPGPGTAVRWNGEWVTQYPFTKPRAP